MAQVEKWGDTGTWGGEVDQKGGDLRGGNGAQAHLLAVHLHAGHAEAAAGPHGLQKLLEGALHQAGLPFTAQHGVSLPWGGHGGTVSAFWGVAAAWGGGVEAHRSRWARRREW